MPEDRATLGAADAFAPDEIALRPRDVHFDWSDTPLHWIPGEPAASHCVSAYHLLFPEVERFFIAAFREAPARARVPQ